MAVKRPGTARSDSLDPKSSPTFHPSPLPLLPDKRHHSPLLHISLTSYRLCLEQCTALHSDNIKVDIATVITTTHAVWAAVNGKNCHTTWQDCGTLIGRQVEMFEIIWHEVEALLPKAPSKNKVEIKCPFFSTSTRAVFTRRTDTSRFVSPQCAACEHTPMDMIKKETNRHCNHGGCGHESGPSERRQGSDCIFDMPEHKRWANLEGGPDIAWVKEKTGEGTSTLANLIRTKRRNHTSGDMDGSVPSIVLRDREWFGMKKSVEDMTQLECNSPLHSNITNGLKEGILLSHLTGSFVVILAAFATLAAHVSTFIHPFISNTESIVLD